MTPGRCGDTRGCARWGGGVAGAGRGASACLPRRLPVLRGVPRPGHTGRASARVVPGRPTRGDVQRLPGHDNTGASGACPVVPAGPSALPADSTAGVPQAGSPGVEPASDHQPCRPAAGLLVGTSHRTARAPAHAGPALVIGRAGRRPAVPATRLRGGLGPAWSAPSRHRRPARLPGDQLGAQRGVLPQVRLRRDRARRRGLPADAHPDLAHGAPPTRVA